MRTAPPRVDILPPLPGSARLEALHRAGLVYPAPGDLLCAAYLLRVDRAQFAAAFVVGLDAGELARAAVVLDEVAGGLSRELLSALAAWCAEPSAEGLERARVEANKK